MQLMCVGVHNVLCEFIILLYYALYVIVYAEIEVRNDSKDCKARITVHALQLLPETAFREHQAIEMFSLEPECSSSLIVPIEVRMCVYVRMYMYVVCVYRT